MAAPREYDRAKLVPLICDRLSTGDPLAVICRDMGIPRRTVNQWRQDDPEIAAEFDDARDVGYDYIAWRTRRTARGYGKSQNGDSQGDTQRDKLIIDTDLKLLAKWDPRRYGEKQQIDHSSSDGTMSPKPVMTKEELRDAVKDVVGKF